jgi:hypothetical protein
VQQPCSLVHRANMIELCGELETAVRWHVLVCCKLKQFCLKLRLAFGNYCSLLFYHNLLSTFTSLAFEQWDTEGVTSITCNMITFVAYFLAYSRFRRRFSSLLFLRQAKHADSPTESK